ncbi:hypothetical protein PsYK624_047990 [Phanerochaete sordida]|uniref:Uncharacterized protein n=1 Tax=Phanerochaete sordida TaxID=48140 RepID=A0A9P3G5M7_9APHY|nr:hypothetical protein PsYK624_047990 [Phanerochaete sordida]
MDAAMSLAIKATLNLFARHDLQSMSWEAALHILRQNPALEDAGNPVSHRSQLLRRPKVHLRSQIDFSVERDVCTWFDDLVKDPDVLGATKIDRKALASIVARTDVAISSLKSFVHKAEYLERPIFDIGLLKFPDSSNPLFRVYHIQLTAWAKREQTLKVIQRDSSGILGSHHSHNFRPCMRILNIVRPLVDKQAVNELEELLHDAPDEGDVVVYQNIAEHIVDNEVRIPDYDIAYIVVIHLACST